MEVEKFYGNKGANLIILVLALVLTAGSYWFWQYGYHTRLMLKLGRLDGIGFVCLIVFGVVSILSIYRILDPRPVLELYPQHLVLRAGITQTLQIPWHHIKTFSEVRNLNMPSIAIELKDIDAFLDENGGKGKLVIRQNAKSGYPPLMIPVSQLEESKERVLKSLNQYLSA
jgi:hypothetical protein